MLPRQEITSAPAPANASLRLARIGGFHAGGRRVRITGKPLRDIAFTGSAAIRHDPNGLFHVEQAYVQYFIPENCQSALPLVLLHGGGFSGSMWERTPDGRDGWLQAFLRRSLAVNVIDNVERGRAGWTSYPEIWPDTPIMRSAEEAWSLFRFGDPAHGPVDDLPGKPFEGLRFPVAHLDDLLMQGVPRWAGHNELALASLMAVLERIGPCVLLAHSQGGELALRAAVAAPDLVREVIAIEPSGFADRLDSGQMQGRRLLCVYGDFLSRSALWTSLVERGRSFCQAWEAAGGTAEWWSLPALGIDGNSHMPMMDDNSDRIADRIADWMLGPAPAQS